MMKSKSKLEIFTYRIVVHRTLFKYKRYLLLKPTKVIINIISSPVDLIKGSGKASFILPMGTKFFIKDILFSPKSNRKLLNFNDIYLHGYDT